MAVAVFNSAATTNQRFRVGLAPHHARRTTTTCRGYFKIPESSEYLIWGDCQGQDRGWIYVRRPVRRHSAPKLVLTKSTGRLVSPQAQTPLEMQFAEKIHVAHFATCLVSRRVISASDAHCKSSEAACGSNLKDCACCRRCFDARSFHIGTAPCAPPRFSVGSNSIRQSRDNENSLPASGVDPAYSFDRCPFSSRSETSLLNNPVPNSGSK